MTLSLKQMWIKWNSKSFIPCCAQVKFLLRACDSSVLEKLRFNT